MDIIYTKDSKNIETIVSEFFPDEVRIRNKRDRKQEFYYLEEKYLDEVIIHLESYREFIIRYRK